MKAMSFSGSVKATVSDYRSRVSAAAPPESSKKKPNKPNDPRHSNEVNGSVHRVLMEELSKVKQEKDRAEKEIKKTEEMKISVKSLIKEIDGVNEEQVLVELARMEAERERREVEVRRAAESELFSEKITETKKKIKELRREISRTKDMEAQLASTMADLEVLQGEMELVRAMKMQSLTENSEKTELEAAKKELENYRLEGFKFMVSMDLAREELSRVFIETAEVKEKEKRTNSVFQQLNSKLLKAKPRLERTVSAIKRSETIIFNLSDAIRQLRADVEAGKKEKELATKEYNCVREETERTEMSMSSTGEKLRKATRELVAAKEAEAASMMNLIAVKERVLTSRGCYPPSVAIVISKSEYLYLESRAKAAKKVADRKIEAAKAWEEAFRVEEQKNFLLLEHRKREN